MIDVILLIQLIKLIIIVKFVLVMIKIIMMEVELDVNIVMLLMGMIVMN